MTSVVPITTESGKKSQDSSNEIFLKPFPVITKHDYSRHMEKSATYDNFPKPIQVQPAQQRPALSGQHLRSSNNDNLLKPIQVLQRASSSDALRSTNFGNYSQYNHPHSAEPPISTRDITNSQIHSNYPTTQQMQYNQQVQQMQQMQQMQNMYYKQNMQQMQPISQTEFSREGVNDNNYLRPLRVQPPLHPTTPPIMTNWMRRPSMIQNCPPGLEYLLTLDKFLIQQKPEISDAFVTFLHDAAYLIKNTAGQQIFYALIRYHGSEGLRCSGREGFTINFFDSLNKEVFRVIREVNNCSGFYCCINCCQNCAYEVRIELPNKFILGYLKQSSSFLQPKFTVLDGNKEPGLIIVGPVCKCSTCPKCNNGAFEIYREKNKTPIGLAQKEYINPFSKEIYSFSISFPTHLPLTTKAILLAAAFFLEYVFYNGNNDDEDDD